MLHVSSLDTVTEWGNEADFLGARPERTWYEQRDNHSRNCQGDSTRPEGRSLGEIIRVPAHCAQWPYVKVEESGESGEQQ